MAIRLFHPKPLVGKSEVIISDDALHHLTVVLRKGCGQKVILFDGSNRVFHASIEHVSKKYAKAVIYEDYEDDRESPLKLHLGQVIAKGDKMQWIVQKAAELGVRELTPLISQRCNVRVGGDRMDKKCEQWQKIAISASEQCGRNQIMKINCPLSLESWLALNDGSLDLTLSPQGAKSLDELAKEYPKTQQIRLLIGPEGGLSGQEIEKTCHCGFEQINLGKRVLRTETAGLAAITLLQHRFGDM